MNIRELLQNLDTIEPHTTGSPVNSLDSIQIEPVEVDNTDYSEGETMIPPQIDSTTACGCSDEQELAPDYEEEEDTDSNIDDLIRLAGMPPIIMISSI